MYRLLTLLILLTASAGLSQELTGVLSSDKLILNEQTASAFRDNYDMHADIEEKSVFMAGIYSALVPGAGQLYNSDYWKAAVFFAVEAAAIYVAVKYEKKGDDQTEFFENFANNNWSARKYAEWTLNNFADKGIVDKNDYTDLINSDGSVNWNALNRLVTVVSKTDVGKYYSHNLAPYGDQQYYEMIGKYSQFNVGWNDFPGGPFTFGDKVTNNFSYYTGLRGKANDYYNISSTAVTVIVSNHIISAIEAALSGFLHNNRIKAKVGAASISNGKAIVFYPELTVQVAF